MAGRREGVMGDLAEVGVKVIGHSGGRRRRACREACGKAELYRGFWGHGGPEAVWVSWGNLGMPRGFVSDRLFFPGGTGSSGASG